MDKENEPSYDQLERNRLRLKFNFESIFQKYSKVDDSRAIEVDPLSGDFYYRAGTARKDVRKHQERFFAANENFGLSALSAPFNDPENLDNQPKLVKACQKKNAKFAEVLALTPWYEGNDTMEESEISETKVVIRHTDNEISCAGISLNALESLIRKKGIQGEIISRSVVDGVAKIVVRQTGTARVKREVEAADVAGPSGNDAYMKKVQRRQVLSIKKEPADEGEMSARLPRVKTELSDDVYDKIERAYAQVEGRPALLIKKKPLDEGGYQQDFHPVKVKREPVDEEISAQIDRSCSEALNSQATLNAPFRRSPNIPKNNLTGKQKEEESADGDDIPSERSDFSVKSGFDSLKAPVRPLPGIEEEETTEDQAAGELTERVKIEESVEDRGKAEERETVEGDEEHQQEADPAEYNSEDEAGENEEEAAGPSRLPNFPLFAGVRKRRSSVQVRTPKSKKSRDSDWGSVEVPRSCSGNESPAETEETPADRLWTGSADSIVNSFRSENGQTVIGLQISAATQMCTESPDRVLLELWADYAADLAKEEAGEIDYVAKEERRNANQAKRRNYHMQNGYKK